MMTALIRFEAAAQGGNGTAYASARQWLSHFCKGDWLVGLSAELTEPSSPLNIALTDALTGTSRDTTALRTAHMLVAVLIEAVLHLPSDVVSSALHDTGVLPNVGRASFLAPWLATRVGMGSVAAGASQEENHRSHRYTELSLAVLQVGSKIQIRRRRRFFTMR